MSDDAASLGSAQSTAPATKPAAENAADKIKQACVAVVLLIVLAAWVSNMFGGCSHIKGEGAARSIAEKTLAAWSSGDDGAEYFKNGLPWGRIINVSSYNFVSSYGYQNEKKEWIQGRTAERFRVHSTNRFGASADLLYDFEMVRLPSGEWRIEYVMHVE